MENSILVSKFSYLGFDVEISKITILISASTSTTMDCYAAKISCDNKIFINNLSFEQISSNFETAINLSEYLLKSENIAKRRIKDLDDCETIEQVITYISCYLTDWDSAEISTDCAAFAINYFYNKISKK